MESRTKRTTSRPRARLALALAAICAGAFVFTSCRTSSPQNSYVIREGSHKVEEVILGGALAGRLKLQDPVSERRQGRYTVQAQLLNNSVQELRMEWQVEWYDERGLLVGRATNWTPERLGGGQILTIRQTAPTEAAVQMRLNVRGSDRIR